MCPDWGVHLTPTAHNRRHFVQSLATLRVPKMWCWIWGFDRLARHRFVAEVALNDDVAAHHKFAHVVLPHCPGRIVDISNAAFDIGKLDAYRTVFVRALRGKVVPDPPSSVIPQSSISGATLGTLRPRASWARASSAVHPLRTGAAMTGRSRRILDQRA